MLDNRKIEELEELGAAFTSVEDAAVILQSDPVLLRNAIDDSNTPEHAAYHRGRLMSEFDTRKSIVQMAKAGSSPAQVLALNLIRKLKMEYA